MSTTLIALVVVALMVSSAKQETCSVPGQCLDSIFITEIDIPSEEVNTNKVQKSKILYLPIFTGLHQRM